MTMTETKISLINIDSELKRLWDEKQGENKIRASLFNLILYVQKDEGSGYYQKLVKSVISKFPCRVLLIIDDQKSNTEYLKNSVSSETLGIGETQIYCEIIQIEVAGKLLERVPFLILPHLLPDLPIYILWTQDPSNENVILRHFEPLAHRIVFDAGLSFDLQAYSRSVISLVQRIPSEIGDLRWTACSGWRNLFAQVFSEVDAFFALTQSKMIRIYYNGKVSSALQNPLAEALYFHAWLASRLNWKFSGIERSEGNLRISYKRPLTEVVFLIIPQDSNELKQGALISIEIESQKNKGFFSFKRHPQSRQVFLQYSDKDRCDLPTVTNLSGIPEGQEIIQEIFYPSAKQHYRDTLELLSQISWRTS